MSKEKRSSILKKVILSICATLVVIILVIMAMWFNEINSIMSMEMIVDAKEENRSAPVYLMDVRGGY